MRLTILAFTVLGATISAWPATVSGKIVDPRGSAVPSARIELTHRDGGFRRTATADGSGEFRFSALPAGQYLIEVRAEGLSMNSQRLTVARDEDWHGELKLDLARVRNEVVVTASATAQSTDEMARAVDTIRDTDFTARAEYSLAEAVQNVTGVRVQSLGGPGSFTRILMRGLRAHDTAVTIDGLRFRDAATTQGDASPFLENLLLVDSSRIDVLRGAGSSVYGTNAVGGVINMVTDEGRDRFHGDVQVEGGGLGMVRGLARAAGNGFHDRLGYSLGTQHVNVTRGVDKQDPYRNTSLQGFVQMRPTPTTSLSGRLLGGDGLVGLNDTPFSAPASFLPTRGTIPAVPIPRDLQRQIEAGGPVRFPGTANFVPNLNDPDSRRASRFAATALLFTHQISPRASWRASYQNVYTRRRFEDGPAGVRFEPQFQTQDFIRGRIHTAQARADVEIARRSLLSLGYEWEREDYLSRSRNAAPPPEAFASQAIASQRSHTGFLHSQNRFLSDRLQLSFSARLQRFDLDPPSFQGGTPVYARLGIVAPPDAKTVDAGLAWFNARTGTKLRAHAGNGYRGPSLFERFGSSFFNGAFSPLGDPFLRPDRSISLDIGADQYLFGERMRLSVTQFYTDLTEVISFDTAGFLRPATDPYGRSAGYINTAGGIARGVELSLETALLRRARLLAGYTYANSDQRRSTVRDNDFFQAPFISPHQFTAVATVPLTRRMAITADAWIVSEHPTILSRRAFLFPGARKIDIVWSYTAPLAETRHLRFHIKVTNALNSEYFENGFRAPGAWATGGVSLRF